MPVLLLLLACTPDPIDSGTPAVDDTADTADTADTTWDPIYDALAAQVEADIAATDAAGASVAVLHNGEIVFAHAFGSARPDADVPPTTQTLFQLGSTTKMFTALALMQKVEEGEVSLEDSLSEALPELEFALDPTWGDQITLHHLLSHQSGIYDYLDWSATDDPDTLATAMYTIYNQLWLMAPPGSFWNYANPNFDYAGLVSEAHDDRYYAELMTEDVFTPLGMDRTFFHAEDVAADGDYALGTGYIFHSATDYEYGPITTLDDVPHMADSAPAGSNTWTTPSQLVQMADFLMSGDTAILSDTLRQELTTSHVSLQMTPDDTGYGYGIFVSPGITIGDDYYETTVWEHGGNTVSFTSSFLMLPEHDFAVAILSSGYGDDFSSSVAEAVRTLDSLPDPVTPPAFEFDADRLDRHVGHYNDPYNVGEATITREGDALYIDMPTLEAYGYTVEDKLYTYSSDIFYVSLNGTWYDLTFIGDEDDTSSTYVRNRAFVLTRDEGKTALPPPPREAVQRALAPALRRLPLRGSPPGALPD